ncbi:MAG: hypothetical protein AAF494_01365 [Pseudomonadota bacterium]
MTEKSEDAISTGESKWKVAAIVLTAIAALLSAVAALLPEVRAFFVGGAEEPSSQTAAIAGTSQASASSDENSMSKNEVGTPITQSPQPKAIGDAEAFRLAEEITQDFIFAAYDWDVDAAVKLATPPFYFTGGPIETKTEIRARFEQRLGSTSLVWSNRQPDRFETMVLNKVTLADRSYVTDRIDQSMLREGAAIRVDALFGRSATSFYFRRDDAGVNLMGVMY